MKEIRNVIQINIIFRIYFNQKSNKENKNPGREIIPIANDERLTLQSI